MGAHTPAAEAAGKKAAKAFTPTSPRVAQVLEYLEQHPIRMQSIPMIYEADTSSAHLPECVQGMTPQDVLPASQAAGSPAATARSKSPAGSTASASGCSSAQADPEAVGHYARVLAGLLYVACGGLDQAHNLVTPLCWGAPTPYAGKPIPGSKAAQDAAYVHALVHRAEGLNDGEFGTGFGNANYWYAATGPHPIQPELLRRMRQHAQGQPQLEQLASNHGDAFSPAKFVAACAEATRSKDARLVGWCEAVAADELRLLVEHCSQRLRSYL